MLDQSNVLLKEQTLSDRNFTFLIPQVANHSFGRPPVYHCVGTLLQIQGLFLIGLSEVYSELQ